MDLTLGKSNTSTLLTSDSKLKALAVVCLYGAPDESILKDSYNTVWVSKFLGHESCKVIDVKTIISVVGMCPYESPEDIGQMTRFFLVEKFGLDMGEVACREEPIGEEYLHLLI